MGAPLRPGEFAGKTVSMEIAGALLSEVLHVKALSVHTHSHEASYFSLLLEGSYSESAPDFAIRYEPYTLVFHQAGTEHSDEIGVSGCRMFFVELLPGRFGFAEGPAPPAHLFELHGGGPAWLVLRLHREFQSGDAASPLTVESLIFDLCSYLSDVPDEESAHEPPWIGQAEMLLQSRFSTRLELREIADHVGVHPSHLCRAFHRYRNRTIGDYVLGLRMQFVCRTLIETSDSLSAISQAAGFTDQSHMTRIFKRVAGVSPGAYRRSLKSRHSLA